HEFRLLWSAARGSPRRHVETIQVEPTWTGKYLVVVDLVGKADQIHHGRLAHQITSAAQAAGGHRRHPDLGADMHIGGIKRGRGRRGAGGCDSGLAEYRPAK